MAGPPGPPGQKVFAQFGTCRAKGNTAVVQAEFSTHPTPPPSRQPSPMLLFSLCSTIRLSCWPVPLLLMYNILKISFPTMIMSYLKDEGSFLLALPFRKQLMGTDLCAGIVFVGDYVTALGL